MQTKANAYNRAVRLRAGLLLSGSAALLGLPVAWRPGTSSATTGDPTALVVLAAAWVAWALTIYLAIGTGLTAASYLAAGPRLAPRFAPRSLRRFVEVAIGASSAAAVCLAPAVAYADGSSPLPPTGPVATASPLDWPVESGTPVESSTVRPHPRMWVRPGDSLWSIAARELGPHATPARIAATWPRLYAANRRAIGANPDLIHPGQQLVPPATQGRTSP